MSIPEMLGLVALEARGVCVPARRRLDVAQALLSTPDAGSIIMDTATDLGMVYVYLVTSRATGNPLVLATTDEPEIRIEDSLNHLRNAFRRNGREIPDDVLETAVAVLFWGAVAKAGGNLPEDVAASLTS